MKILPEIGHRNLVPFEGVGLLVDVPTDSPVQFINYDAKKVGESARLIFRRSAVENALESLIGMGVCVEAKNFNGHAPRSKVGLVTEAWIEGNRLALRGFIYGLDFPEVVAELQRLRNKVGMCPAFRDVVIEPPTEPNPQTVVVTQLCFTGVAILTRESAHFSATTIRIIPQSYRWSCSRPGCDVFTIGTQPQLCSHHQPSS